jgi:hypothetical protein
MLTVDNGKQFDS